MVDYRTRLEDIKRICRDLKGVLTSKKIRFRVDLREVEEEIPVCVINNVKYIEWEPYSQKTCILAGREYSCTTGIYGIVDKRGDITITRIMRSQEHVTIMDIYRREIDEIHIEPQPYETVLHRYPMIVIEK